MAAGQLVIKLNKKRFEPIIKQLQDFDCGLSRTASECVSKILFIMHEMFNTKRADGKLDMQVVLERWDLDAKDPEKASVQLVQRYLEFLKETK